MLILDLYIEEKTFPINNISVHKCQEEKILFNKKECLTFSKNKLCQGSNSVLDNLDQLWKKLVRADYPFSNGF